MKNIADVSECSDNAHSPQFAQVHMAKIKADNNESNKTDFFLSAAKASHIFLFPFGEDIEMEEDIQWPKDESLLLEDSQEKRINTLAPKDTEYQDRQYFEDACESQLSKSTILDISLLQRSTVDNSKVYREPCMVSIHPSCPKAAFIPGLPSLYLQENAIKWLSPEDTISCKKEPAMLIHHMGIQYNDIKILKKMILLKPSCPKSVSVPGFPSVALDTMDIPSSVNFLPTCSKASRISGLPSRLPLTISDPESWLKNNMMLWERKKKKSRVQILHSFKESSDMYKAMLLIRPCCPTASKVPGFPSIPRSIPQEHQSIINMLPSCPKMSSIAGVPSALLCIEKDLLLYQSDNTPLFVMQSKKDKVCVICDLGKPYDIKQVRNMLSLTLTCPTTAAPGFPSAPIHIEKAPNAVNLCPTCPTTSMIFGMPSTLLVIEPDDKNKHTDSVILWRRELKKIEPRILVMFIYNAETTKSTSLIRSTCSTQSRIPGFPSTTKRSSHKHQNIVNMMSSCPSNSKIVGFPSLTIMRTNQDIQQWRLNSERFIQMPKKRMPNIILNKVLDTFKENIDFVKTMVAFVPSCPKQACSPGFPSITTPNYESSWCCPSAPLPKPEKHLTSPSAIETSTPVRLESSLTSSFSMTHHPIITEENKSSNERYVAMQHVSNSSDANELTHINETKLNASSLEETKEDIGVWTKSEEGEKGILESG